LERFQREAQAASALNHPNICTVYDAGELEGRPFIAMELLQGKTLEQKLADEPLSVEQVIRMGSQIADALEAAHQGGIIHRDIKPSNIFITSRGEAKILDFGLAKLQEAEAAEAGEVLGERSELVSRFTLTRTGEAMGTAGYMSPEQIRGERLDCRTDLFSFGLVLYEMTIGKHAFARDTAHDVQKAILEETAMPMRALVPRVPARLEKIVSKALQKDRGARYQHASELQAALKDLQQELQAAKPTSWLGAKRGLYPLAATTLVLTGVGLILFFQKKPAQWSHEITRLTFDSTLSWHPAVSPDGKYVAYGADRGSNALHIWIQELPNGDPIRLTKDEANRPGGWRNLCNFASRWGAEAARSECYPAAVLA
jgi:eukaryotic-like serine/threonine-protein kinase